MLTAAMNPGNDWYQALALPEQQAIDGHLEAKNRLPWRLALGGSTLLSVVAILYQASEGAWLRAGLWLLMLLGLFGIYLARRSPTFGRRARAVLLGHLAVLPVAAALTIDDAMAGFVLVTIILPLTLLFFRFLPVETFGLATLMAVVSAWMITRVAATTDDSIIPLMVVGTIWIGATSLASNALSKRTRGAYLEDWRVQVRLAREHRRMRGELDDARTLQLGMLPSTLPAFPWLDLSAICLPASEVGGDYYDVLALEDGRLAIVIADVSGHGMSSGMVLASLRGGLYVLRDELDHPVAALERLDRMLRTIAGRMFVTVQLAILDPVRGEVNVISAGHPPLIVTDTQGEVTFLGKPAPPLGTALDAPPAEDRRTLAPGDTLVLYSDGLVEAVNHRGEALGFDRIAEHIGRLAPHSDARQLRDGLLSRIATFKGDGEQADDMTIVALRFLGSRRKAAETSADDSPSA